MQSDSANSYNFRFTISVSVTRSNTLYLNASVRSSSRQINSTSVSNRFHLLLKLFESNYLIKVWLALSQDNRDCRLEDVACPTLQYWLILFSSGTCTPIVLPCNLLEYVSVKTSAVYRYWDMRFLGEEILSLVKCSQNNSPNICRRYLYIPQVRLKVINIDENDCSMFIDLSGVSG